ncbi:MAG: glucosaminidase domain-containing protein [Bacillaceae bacterium]|nr:glucosaminidase domain-containing protein [Bacillaceae bacterium]
MKKTVIVSLLLVLLVNPQQIYANNSQENPKKEERESLSDSEVVRKEDIENDSEEEKTKKLDDDSDDENVHLVNDDENTTDIGPEINKSITSLVDRNNDNKRDEKNIDNSDLGNELEFEEPQNISTKTLDSEIKVQSNQQPTTPDEWLKYAKSKVDAIERFDAYINGYSEYPEDHRFIQGINETASVLLNSATVEHLQKKFDNAEILYKKILSSPVLDEIIKLETEHKLKFSKQRIDISSLNNWIQLAQSHKSSSVRLSLFIEGYSLFPQDKRITDGINTSANSLLIWASAQHRSGEFTTAVDRYERILNAPVLDEVMRLETEHKLSYAKQKKALSTSDQWYELAIGHGSSSVRLSLFNQGYNLFPNDIRFVDGINSSAFSLLTWASTQHRQNDFLTAEDRYQRILSSPILDEVIKLETEYKLELSKKRTDINSANNWYDIASFHKSSSVRLSLFVEGYRIYPNDNRFKEGINSNAQSLLTWATTQHRLMDFATAEDRYNRILSAPLLDEIVELVTEHKLDYARSRTDISTASNWISMASSHKSSSVRLFLFNEGYTHFRNDIRIRNGIDTNAQSLLTWTSSHHRQGDFTLAEDRYNRILSSLILDEVIRLETEHKLNYAKQRIDLSIANNWLELARSHNSSSVRLSLYSEGYKVFPTDNRFEDGINTSVRSLLNWAGIQHRQKKYDIAEDRYKRILSSPAVDEAMRLETEYKLKFAKQKNDVSTANNWLAFASGHNSSSVRLALFAEGNTAFPSDKRFIDGLNLSAKSLLDWAKRQHENRDFQTAIHRYNLIINTPGISSVIKNEASNNLVLALDGKTLSREIIEYTKYDITLMEALSVQLKLNPPPQTDKYRNDPAFIHSSIVDIVEKAVIAGDPVNLRTAPNLNSDSIYGSVRRGTIVTIISEVSGSNWNGSNRWYEIIYEGTTLYVHSLLVDVNEVAIVKSTANMRQLANASSHSFGTVSKDTELTILSEVIGSSVNGNDRWFEVRFNRTWRNASTSDIIPFIDPLRNDIFQHLVLSTSVGVPVSQINNILLNKGVLHGKGQAFIDASKQHSVNEIYLIAHALLETGHGNSQLAKGIEVGINKNGNLELVSSLNRSILSNIRTVYNMYGINAVDSDPIRQGAFYAYNNNWFSTESAIIGGAKFIGDRYINSNQKQDTLYKMRWNPANPGTRQYATDMAWAVKQISTIKNLYNQLDDPVLHFDIPVYK